MTPPRVLVLYNEPVLPPGHPDAASEQDVLYSVKVVTESLATERVPAEKLGVTEPAALIAGVRKHAPDVVFNLFEGTADQGNTEAAVGGLLEWLRVPYTGCPTQAMVVARNKPLAKHLLAGAGVRTPAFFVIDGGPCPPNRLGWPVIVKPAREDASVGIEQAAVVTSDRQLRDRVDFVVANYGGPVLVEQFVTGREIHATLVELGDTDAPTALPFAEIRFEPADDLWPIYSYTAKWDEASREFALRPVDVPVTLPPESTGRLVRAAEAAYRLLGCRDFARVDARVTADGEVYLLEVNPNPSITSIMLDAGLTAIGWKYDAYIAHVARRAAARGGTAGVNPYARPAGT